MTQQAADVIVIGAGVAGLAAAQSLAAAGRHVLLLEARDRMGGRIWTVRNLEGTALELGAEFVHGRPKEIFDLVAQSGLELHESGGTQWVANNGQLERSADFFANLRGVLDTMSEDGYDHSFARHLDLVCGDNAEARLWGLEYVEGFHGAIAEKISVHSLAHSRRAEAAIDGHRSFRFAEGYQALVKGMREALPATFVRTYLGTMVRRVEWSGPWVTVEADTPTGPAKFSASAAVITLPLGVLQAPAGGPGAVEFAPPLEEKASPLALLFMGQTIRVNLVFRTRWWDELAADGGGLRELGMLHSHEEWFPTWWTPQGQAAVLTGWAASRRGERLSGRTQDFIREKALESLHVLLNVPVRQLESDLRSWHVHDWQSDPFSRGSYSYAAVGGEGAQKALAAPVGGRLFFAGEATVSDGHHATVHGAIASGYRAAREVLARQK